MIGDSDERVVAAENHVAAYLSTQREADLGQRTGAFPAGDARKFAHTATINVPWQ